MPTMAGMLPVPAGGEPKEQKTPFDVNYTEGLKVGYKWFEAEGKEPLFPFGFGLSYTTYAYSALEATRRATEGDLPRHQHRRARRGGGCAGVRPLPSSAGEPFKRLIGWQKVPLAHGETKTVTVTVEPQYLSIFNVEKEGWELAPGEYKIVVGGSSEDTPLSQTVTIADPGSWFVGATLGASVGTPPITRPVTAGESVCSRATFIPGA